MRGVLEFVIAQKKLIYLGTYDASFLFRSCLALLSLTKQGRRGITMFPVLFSYKRIISTSFLE